MSKLTDTLVGELPVGAYFHQKSSWSGKSTEKGQQVSQSLFQVIKPSRYIGKVKAYESDLRHDKTTRVKDRVLLICCSNGQIYSIPKNDYVHHVKNVELSEKNDSI